jgi:protein-S-isoprenylcysteine O-methyltransferase Ste14
LNNLINGKKRAKFLWIIPSSIFFFIIVPSLTFIISRYIEKKLEIQLFLGDSYVYIGVPFLVYGGYYILESIRILFIMGNGVPLGDLIQEEQSSKLVVDGIYKKTRNPMLFGYLVSFIGLGFLLNSPIMVILFPLLYLGIWTLWLKSYEEPALEKRFGESYVKYKKDTPFLIPKYFKSNYN